MTRTERSTSPRAILKDRSESKSGYDKSLRKGGAGPHNWGAVRDELAQARDALADTDASLDDDAADPDDAAQVDPSVNAAVRPQVDGPPAPTPDADANAHAKPESGSGSGPDGLDARAFRARGLRGSGVDLAAIARTSAGASAGAGAGAAPALEVGRDAVTRTLV